MANTVFPVVSSSGGNPAYSVTCTNINTTYLATQSLTVGIYNVTVSPSSAVVTVDLRNTDEALLKIAEQKLNAFLTKLSNEEGVTITSHRLARFEPVKFDQSIADLIASKAQTLGYSCRTMTSGAGHDAQMMARFCPSAMIFVPSVKGISHNPAEHTEVADLVAGGNVLLQTLLELAK